MSHPTIIKVSSHTYNLTASPGPLCTRLLTEYNARQLAPSQVHYDLVLISSNDYFNLEVELGRGHVRPAPQLKINGFNVCLDRSKTDGNSEWRTSANTALIPIGSVAANPLPYATGNGTYTLPTGLPLNGQLNPPSTTGGSIINYSATVAEEEAMIKAALIMRDNMGCYHEWSMYQGLFESFEHCTKCGEKRK